MITSFKSYYDNQYPRLVHVIKSAYKDYYIAVVDSPYDTPEIAYRMNKTELENRFSITLGDSTEYEIWQFFELSKYGRKEAVLPIQRAVVDVVKENDLPLTYLLHEVGDMNNFELYVKHIFIGTLSRRSEKYNFKFTSHENTEAV